jgi:pimeloyl-ACP methyl ester carboxylesterase
MKRAQVDDITLEYDVWGVGEPVVFIHGAFIADTFGPLVGEPGLAGRYQLITYRRRGYGGSTRTPGPIGAERQAADCTGLLRHLGVQRAHVVGHSFGGCIALQLALDAPDLVHSLALLEPALFVGASAPSYRESLLRSVQRYRQEGAVVVMEDFFRARWPAYSRDALEGVLPGAFAQAVADAPTTFELDIGLVDWAFGETEARRIRQPTLVVLGGGSPALHPRFEETYRLLLEWLPAAEGFVLPAATHFLQVESANASEGLAAALAGFLARSPIDGGARQGAL